MINVGIVGCGVMGMIHAKCLQIIPKAKIIATYDMDQSISQDLASKLGAESCRSLKEVLSIEDLDAVYVCTRHDSHREIVEKAADAGKHIFCEKPMALTFEDSEEMAKYVKKKHVHFMIGFNFRRAPIIDRVREVLGREKHSPLVVNLTLSAPHFLEGWQGRSEQGGGILPCLGVHGFDLLPYLLRRKIIAVSCFGRRLRLPEPYLEDSALVLLRFEDKTLGSAVFHDYAPGTYSFLPEKNLLKLDLFSTHEVISVVGFNRVEICRENHKEILLESGCAPAESNDLLWSRGYVAQSNHFVDSLLQDRDPDPGPDSGVTAARLVDASRRSLQEHRTIEL